MSGDLIGDACDRLLELAPTIDPGVVRLLELELRAGYGGEQLYIQQKRPVKRDPVQVEQIRPDLPVKAQAEQLGVSRQHLYRLLRAKGQRG